MNKAVAPASRNADICGYGSLRSQGRRVESVPLGRVESVRLARYASNTASAPVTASALSVTVFSSDVACTEIFSAKNRASVT